MELFRRFGYLEHKLKQAYCRFSGSCGSLRNSTGGVASQERLYIYPTVIIVRCSCIVLPHLLDQIVQFCFFSLQAARQFQPVLKHPEMPPCQIQRFVFIVEFDFSLNPLPVFGREALDLYRGHCRQILRKRIFPDRGLVELTTLAGFTRAILASSARIRSWLIPVRRDRSAIAIFYCL